jgi:hypothetical protein
MQIIVNHHEPFKVARVGSFELPSYAQTEFRDVQENAIRIKKQMQSRSASLKFLYPDSVATNISSIDNLIKKIITVNSHESYESLPEMLSLIHI